MRRWGRPFLFGNVIGQVVGGSSSRSLVLKADGASLATVTYVQSVEGQSDPTKPARAEKCVTIYIRPSHMTASGEARMVNGPNPTSPSWEQCRIAAPEAVLQKLKDSPFNAIQFRVAQATLEAFTDDTELPTVSALHSPEGHDDPVLLHLAEMIFPWVDEKLAFPEHLLDLYLQMLCGQLVLSYGIASSASKCYQGGLAPWQKRRTLELLEGTLGGDLRLNRLASECGLSASYFCRCFRVTFGTSAHQFVINRRIRRAQHLLLQSTLSLAEIAIETGFSDQAAFSRAFGGTVGTPPARWRTEHLVRTR